MPDYTLKTEIGDGDVPVTIEFEYFPGTPAKLTGPMEDSYPAEGPTLEVSEVLISTSDKVLDIADIISNAWRVEIEERCISYVASIGEA